MRPVGHGMRASSTSRASRATGLPSSRGFAPRRVDDRRHVPDDDDATTVENTEPSYTDLTVADATGIEAGDSFSVVDVKTGDRTAVPASAEVRRVDGEYEVSATDDVDFKPPKGGSKG